MRLQKNTFIGLGLMVLAVAAICVAWRLTAVRDPNTPPETHQGATAPSTLQDNNLPQGGSRPDLATPLSATPPADKTPPPIAATTPAPNKEHATVSALQELLDDDAKHTQARVMAMTMAVTGSDYEQLEAVNALRWLGGQDAQKTLVKVMASAGEEAATEARYVLMHLLTEDLITDSPAPFDPSLWKEAIEAAGDESEQEAFMVLLGAHPPRHAVPVLLDLLESDDDNLKQLAQEHLEANTSGEEITTREQGEEWLTEHLEEQEKIQLEEEQELAAAEEGAVDLPRFAELKKLEEEEAQKTAAAEEEEKEDQKATEEKEKEEEEEEEGEEEEEEEEEEEAQKAEEEKATEEN